jgi:hypothetical protein
VLRDQTMRGSRPGRTGHSAGIGREPDRITARRTPPAEAGTPATRPRLPRSDRLVSGGPRRRARWIVTERA